MIKENIIIYDRKKSAMTRLNENLVEDGKKEYVFEGICADFNDHNENGRLYDKEEYLKLVDELRKEIKEYGLMGELDHKDGDDDDDFKDPSPQMRFVSHIIEDLWYDEEANQVKIRIKLLDTKDGQQAKAIVDGGGKLYISQRAYGYYDESTGKAIPMEIYTYDIVYRPGFKNAKLNRLYESKNSIIAYKPVNKIEKSPNKNNNNMEDIKSLNEELNDTKLQLKQLKNIVSKTMNLSENKNSDNNEFIGLIVSLSEKVDEINKKVDSIKDEMDSKVEDIKKEVEDAVEDVVNMTVDLKEETEKAVEDVINIVSDNREETEKAVEDVVNMTVDLKEETEKAVEDVVNMTVDLKEETEKAVEDVVNITTNLEEEVEEAVVDIIKTTDNDKVAMVVDGMTIIATDDGDNTKIEVVKDGEVTKTIIIEGKSDNKESLINQVVSAMDGSEEMDEEDVYTRKAVVSYTNDTKKKNIEHILDGLIEKYGDVSYSEENGKIVVKFNDVAVVEELRNKGVTIESEDMNENVSTKYILKKLSEELEAAKNKAASDVNTQDSYPFLSVLDDEYKQVFESLPDVTKERISKLVKDDMDKEAIMGVIDGVTSDKDVVSMEESMTPEIRKMWESLDVSTRIKVSQLWKMQKPSDDFEKEIFWENLNIKSFNESNKTRKSRYSNDIDYGLGYDDNYIDDLLGI